MTIGRPTECTEAMTVEVCEWLSKGCSIRATLKIVGLNMPTWVDWKARGGTGEEPFATFLHRTTRAIGEGLAGRLNNITAAKDWRADAWMLERMHPDEFGRRTEITGPEGAPIAVVGIDPRGMTDEQIAEALKKLGVGGEAP